MERESDNRTRVAIVGTGWAGYTLAHKLDSRKYDITVISPESTCAYTPLLASAACGLFDLRLAEEPIRRKTLKFTYIKAFVTDVDFRNGLLTCKPAFKTLSGGPFSINFDQIILAPGCKTNDFNTPGVEEHALYVKNVSDATVVRNKLGELLEMASLPSAPEIEQRRLLHFVIVGGGPTGVEMAAELSDLINGGTGELYPNLKDKISIALHDVAPQILAPFERKLSEYATSSLRSHSVEVKVNSHIEKVTETSIKTREEGEIGYGMLIWATGNKNVDLVDTLKVSKSSHGLKRILTDQNLRVLAEDGTAMSNAFALGDAADIDGKSLPTTAEVATQKADYLVRVFNAASDESLAPFKYQQRKMVTYTGQKDGVVEGAEYHTGYAAWLSWRSGNLLWTRSWRRRLMMCISWFLDWLGGRDIARN